MLFCEPLNGFNGILIPGVEPKLFGNPFKPKWLKRAGVPMNMVYLVKNGGNTFGEVGKHMLGRYFKNLTE